MEGNRAAVGLGADLVGLAGRDEENLGLLGLLVDRHLHVRGEATHDGLALLVLDQLLGALGADGGLELVVAEQHLDLAAQDATLGIELVGRELSAPLHVRGERREGSGQRQREADAERFGLRAKHRGEEPLGGDRTGSHARGGQEFATCDRRHRHILLRNGSGRREPGAPLIAGDSRHVKATPQRSRLGQRAPKSRKPLPSFARRSRSGAGVQGSP